MLVFIWDIRWFGQRFFYLFSRNDGSDHRCFLHFVFPRNMRDLSCRGLVCWFISHMWALVYRQYWWGYILCRALLWVPWAPTGSHLLMDDPTPLAVVETSVHKLCVDFGIFCYNNIIWTFCKFCYFRCWICFHNVFLAKNMRLESQDLVWAIGRMIFLIACAGDWTSLTAGLRFFNKIIGAVVLFFYDLLVILCGARIRFVTLLSLFIFYFDSHLSFVLVELLWWGLIFRCDRVNLIQHFTMTITLVGCDSMIYASFLWCSIKNLLYLLLLFFEIFWRLINAKLLFRCTF